ncbi:hypothetical protein BJ508DRAFT_373822 [Ascobolus immersus RN42]|uniref:Uncharacterized protein n=1 Tax=Ascobolus immersus RN42 TaxID=1160509 RepID=A0A3N4IG20_ASCIM|nr:hypothetical protein BJ508DRAFT_373822 [Ascobolus immersus RN42]
MYGRPRRAEQDELKKFLELPQPDQPDFTIPENRLTQPPSRVVNVATQLENMAARYSTVVADMPDETQFAPSNMHRVRNQAFWIIPPAYQEPHMASGSGTSRGAAHEDLDDDDYCDPLEMPDAPTTASPGESTVARNGRNFAAENASPHGSVSSAYQVQRLPSPAPIPAPLPDSAYHEPSSHRQPISKQSKAFYLVSPPLPPQNTNVNVRHNVRNGAEHTDRFTRTRARVPPRPRPGATGEKPIKEGDFDGLNLGFSAPEER